MNYAVFSKASDDAVKLFSIERLFRDAVLTGKAYPPMGVLSISKALYPDAPIGVNLS